MSQPQKQKTEDQIRHEIRQQVLAEAATSGQVVTIERGRLPYPKGLEERFDVSPAQWRALTDSVFPSAKTPEGVVLAIAYCKARKLDIMKRPVHVVPIWDSKKRREVESVWEGIGSLRTTAHRTGVYAGCDPCEFGPMMKSTFTAEVERNGNSTTQSVTVEHPEWARLTVYRLVQGVRCAFPGPKVRWLAAYGRKGGTELPNEMWAKRDSEQLEKCAEAASLRRAFPEELGDVYTAEEMHGQVVDITPEPSAEDRAARPQRGGSAPAAEDVIDAEIEESGDQPPPALEIQMPDGEVREFTDPADYGKTFSDTIQQLARAGDRKAFDGFWDTNSGMFATLRQTPDGTREAEELTAEYRDLEADLTKREAETRKAAQREPSTQKPDPSTGTAETTPAKPPASTRSAPASAEAKPEPWVFKPIGGRDKAVTLAGASEFAEAMLKAIREQGYAPSPVSTFAFKLNEPGMKRLDNVEPDLHAQVLQACRDAGCEV